MPELVRSEWEHLFEPWFANEGHRANPTSAEREQSLFHEASQPLAVRRTDYVRRQSPRTRAIDLRTANAITAMERLLVFAERRHLGVERMEGDARVARAPRPATARHELEPVRRPPVAVAVGFSASADKDDADREAETRRSTAPGISSPEPRAPSSQPRGPLRGLLAFASIALIAVYVGYVQRSAEAAMSRATAAERTATAVQRSAHDAVTAAADRAQRTIAGALTQATRAERMIDVMAAPDARRIELAGRSAAPAAVGQALYSRSRGVILSASDMPRPLAGHVFQLWATTTAGPVRLGLATPDAQGRIAAAYDLPPDVAVSIRGFVVTQEPAGRVASPGVTLLAAR